MKRLLLASLVAGAVPAVAQTASTADSGMTPQKRAELREAVKAQQIQSMGIGSSDAEAVPERKLTMQELSEMREQLRKQREARKPGVQSP